jgi:hypothetical protein
MPSNSSCFRCRDGFLMLIIPIIKSTSRYPLKIFIRATPTVSSEGATASSTESNPETGMGMHDLRIKLLAENTTRSVSTSSDSGNFKWSSDFWKRSGGSGSISGATDTIAAGYSDGVLSSKGPTASSISSPSNLSRVNSQAGQPTMVLSASGDTIACATNGAGAGSGLSDRPGIANITSSLLSILPASWANIVAPSSSSSSATVGQQTLSDAQLRSMVAAQLNPSNSGTDSTASAHSAVVSGFATPRTGTPGTMTNASVPFSEPDSAAVGGSITPSRYSAGNNKADKVAARLAALRKQ